MESLPDLTSFDVQFLESVFFTKQQREIDINNIRVLESSFLKQDVSDSLLLETRKTKIDKIKLLIEKCVYFSYSTIAPLDMYTKEMCDTWNKLIDIESRHQSCLNVIKLEIKQEVVDFHVIKRLILLSNALNDDNVLSSKDACLSINNKKKRLLALANCLIEIYKIV